MSQVLAALVGFLFMSLGSRWIWLALLLLVVALVIAHQSAEPIEYRKYWLLAVLPAVWIVYQALTGDWRNLFRQLDQLEAVTPADVQRVAREIFTSNNRTIATIEPLPAETVGDKK